MANPKTCEHCGAELDTVYRRTCETLSFCHNTRQYVAEAERTHWDSYECSSVGVEDTCPYCDQRTTALEDMEGE